jgi:hypothetical protein
MKNFELIIFILIVAGYNLLKSESNLERIRAQDYHSVDVNHQESGKNRALFISSYYDSVYISNNNGFSLRFTLQENKYNFRMSFIKTIL